ncbi:hypothetical protein P5673_009644, partial [Acropora cervicornis]
FNISFHYVVTIRFCNIVKHRYLLNKAVVVAIKDNDNKKKFANARRHIHDAEHKAASSERVALHLLNYL